MTSRPWKVDFREDELKRYRNGELSPPGRSLTQSDASAPRSQPDQSNLKIKKAWDLALAQIKNILTMAFVMWMTPNQPNLIPLSITIFSASTPLEAIFSINKTYAPFEDKKTKASLLLPKLIFFLLNVLAVCTVVWKLGKFGLLPTQADWIQSYTPPQATEISVGGFV